MAIGSGRRNGYVKEKTWGGVYATVKAATGTTLTLNGAGGPNVGMPLVAVGQKIHFLDDTSQVAFTVKTATGFDAQGVGDAVIGFDTGETLGTPANHVGKRVLLAQPITKAALFDAFSSNRNQNNWGSKPYTGTRSANVGRSKGRIEVDGSGEIMLRPTVNMPLLVGAVGPDRSVSGTPVSPAVSNTTSGAVAAGATTVALTDATGFEQDGFINLDRGDKTKSEVRKIVSVATNTVTVDVAFEFNHASGADAEVVQRPFVHYVPAAKNRLDSFTMEDYIPFDDEADLVDGVAQTSYLLTGVKFKGFKAESQTEQGIAISLDYQAQDKVIVKSPAALPIPEEALFDFSEEAIIFDGARNYKAKESSLESDNDLQPEYTKNGSNRPSKLTPGMNEVKGSFKFSENAATIGYLWPKMESNTPVAYKWEITDDGTSDFVRFTCPQIIIDTVNDGDFGPADLVDVDVEFTAIHDSTLGATFLLEVGNSDYLRY